ncbi:MAG: ribosome-associated translation inhibitor RaiA [Solobacterium sp.]|nr:ribosome-associated translation inhibitor RaiA [Solobacterium sp.]MBR2768318.1 ribosome-associated translation inhibitor RaiA [Solobacterium sp.]MBR2795223.1 ribosome-associated translation inhibitor RaiA [Solobacterium sp.]
MRFEIVGKNVTITEPMRAKIEKKLSGLQKYLLIDPDTTARVVARVYPASQKIEVTIPTRVGILRTEVEHEDIYSAVDIALDKLEDQLRRQKTRLNRRHRDSLAETFILEEEEEEIDIPVKTKTLAAERMDLEEAIMQMELSNHDFYIYTDDESDRISVVYRRNNGGYGLIETE